MKDMTVKYDLLPPTPDESHLFSLLKGETAERHGAIGLMKTSFGEHGRYPNDIWTNGHKHLKTQRFNDELARFISYLRCDVFTDLDSSGDHRWKRYASGLLDRNGWGIKAKNDGYSFYVRCMPNISGVDTFALAYDNRYLLPELAGKHRLPKDCYSILPSSGELIFIVRGKYGYFPSNNSTGFPDIDRRIADESNAHDGVTRAQEEAMLAGSLFGWDAPAAKPWKYDMDGKPRPLPPKKNEPER